jgi:hypothetical protein
VLLDVVNSEGLNVAQVFDGAVDVGALLDKIGDGLVGAFDHDAGLCQVIGVGVVQLQPIADLFEREAKVLAALDELQARALPARVAPRDPLARWRDQALALVKSDGARGDTPNASASSPIVNRRSGESGLSIATSLSVGRRAGRGKLLVVI